MNEQQRRHLCAASLFLTLLGLYLFTAPGRIDIIDGQWRYEVAKNWLDHGEPTVTDRWLFMTGEQLRNAQTGKSYARYNALPSLTPLPLMVLSRRLPRPTAERDRFAFSLVGPIFGALTGGLLVLCYGWLGIGLRRSLLYTGVFSLATLWWPASVTVFDQNQHAVLLLAAIMLAWQSGRRGSLGLAGASGLIGGLLLNYQEMYALLLPVVGLATLACPQEGSPGAQAALRSPPDRAALGRYLVFTLCCGVGLGLFCGYNYLRFGTPLVLARYPSEGPAGELLLWGNPLAGFLSLLVSPGKGVLWFSPPLALALLGARRLTARAPVLAATVAGVCAIHLLVICRLAFFGGDWCWGPRYTVPLLPLCALAFPFAIAPGANWRRCVVPLAAAGLLVQLLGISIDNNRFFFQPCFPGNFWAADPWVYFKHSQLAARPFEIAASVREGPPPEATRFSSAPNGQATYCQWGPAYTADAPRWVRHFQVFHLARPWWGWVGHVPPEQRPVDPGTMLAVCAALLASGGLMLLLVLRAAVTHLEVSAGAAAQHSRAASTGQPAPAAFQPSERLAPGGSPGG